MTPPTIILNGQPIAAKCSIATPKAGAKELLSCDVIIGKLKGTNTTEIEKNLNYLIKHGLCNTRFVQPLLSLFSSNNPVIFGKALIVLMLMKENGIKFTINQEETFTKRLNGAQIQFSNGGIKITGNGFHLPNGAILNQGTISFKDGQWFIAKGDSAVISGIKIINEDSGETWKVDLFFDGKEYRESKTFFSIDVNQGKLSIGSKATFYVSVISLGKDNPFVPIDKSDDVKIGTERGKTLTIENRTKAGLIPKITIKTPNGKGYATINNGWIQVGIAAKGIVCIGLGRGGSHNLARQSPTTAPFEMVLVDNAGHPKMLETHNTSDALNTRYGGFKKVAGQGYRLIFNNYSQVGLLDLGQETRTKFIDGFGPFKIDTSLSGNTKEYTIKDFQTFFPNISLTGNIDSTNIKLAIDYLLSLPPKMLASIKGIDFPVIWESAGLAYATSDGIIHLMRATFDMFSFQHECAHILTFHLENKIVEGANATLTAVGLKPITNVLTKVKKQSFKGRWQSIAGDVYSKYIDPDTKYNINPGWKKNGLDDGPRHGCVKSYGSKDFYEDVATFVEQIWKNPEFFSPLVNPKSASYDPRYKQKLALLLEYGFINKAQYDKVISTPVKRIYTVK